MVINEGVGHYSHGNHDEEEGRAEGAGGRSPGIVYQP